MEKTPNNPLIYLMGEMGNIVTALSELKHKCTPLGGDYCPFCYARRLAIENLNICINTANTGHVPFKCDKCGHIVSHTEVTDYDGDKLLCQNCCDLLEARAEALKDE